MSTSPSFQRLLSSIRKGDPVAVETIVQRFTGRLMGLAVRRMSQRLKQRVDPEDVVQSVFKMFFVQGDVGDWKLENWDSLWGVLLTIALRRINNLVERHTAARRSVEREELLSEYETALNREPETADVLIAEELLEQLMNAMSEKYRPIVQQILVGATHEAIARDLNTSLSTVERVHRRAKECLARILAVEEAA